MSTVGMVNSSFSEGGCLATYDLITELHIIFTMKDEQSIESAPKTRRENHKM